MTCLCYRKQKELGQGLVGGRSPPEADHADDILQFNAQIC